MKLFPFHFQIPLPITCTDWQLHMPRTSKRKAIWYSDAYIAGIASTVTIAILDCTGVTYAVELVVSLWEKKSEEMTESCLCHRMNEP